MVICGVGLGTGVWLVIAGVPGSHPLTFSDRIHSQLKSQSVGSRLLQAPAAESVPPFGPLQRILAPIIRDARGFLARHSPGTRALTLRLAQAGIDKTALDFRAEQLLWGALGFAAAIGCVAVTVSLGKFSILTALLVVLAGALGGYLFRDYWLGVQVSRRSARMMAEFPSVAELMALAVGAGESAAGALERVCNTSNGELSREFTKVLASTRSGVPMTSALLEFSARTDLSPLLRFVDGLVVAIERGTPLADILRAQAQDVRDTAKRDLMESAGKKEIAMMVPLVFGVLPLTVVFAVFPGLVAITVGL